MMPRMVDNQELGIQEAMLGILHVYYFFMEFFDINELFHNYFEEHKIPATAQFNYLWVVPLALYTVAHEFESTSAMKR